MAMQLTDSNFKESVLDANQVALVDFWAEWCGPCRMIGPVVEELSAEYKDKAVIGKMNVDDNPEVAMQYGIRSIPTILFFKNGQLVHLLHRYQIERMGAEDIAEELINVYNAHCTKEQSMETIEQLRALFIEKYKVDPLQLSNE